MAGGLQLPGFLKPFLAELGVEWPDADEAALFKIAKAFADTAKGFSGHRSDVKSAGDEMFDDNRGPGITEMKLFFTRIAGLGGHIMFTEAICAALAGAYGAAAATVLAAKLRIIALLMAYAAEKLALLALIAKFPQVAVYLERLAELARETARIIKQVIDVTTELLAPLLETAVDVVAVYTDVAVPVLQARKMDDERDELGGTPALPPGIDPDKEYRQSLTTDPNSPYHGNPDALPGNPPGRSTQPFDGQQEGGGTWGPASHGMVEDAKGQKYQEYVTGVQHPGGSEKPLELKLPDANGRTRDFDGYVPPGARGPGSPAAYQDSKDITKPIDGSGWWANHYRNTLVDEARGQLGAIDASTSSGTSVLEWHVSSPEAAEVLRQRFAEDPALRGRVFVFYTPMK